MNSGVIPRWHHSAILLLRRVPVRRHIGIQTEEDDERLGIGVAFAPLQVGARHMSGDSPVFTLGLIQQQWEMGGYQPLGSHGDQGRQLTLLHGRMKQSEVGYLKGFGSVHARLRLLVLYHLDFLQGASWLRHRATSMRVREQLAPNRPFLNHRSRNVRARSCTWAVSAVFPLFPASGRAFLSAP